MPSVAKPSGPLPQSTVEAARLANDRHWTVRVITFERDTTVGYVRLEGERIRVGSRTFTPGEIYVMQRRVGSTHVAEKTLLTIALTSVASMLLGEVWRNASSDAPPTAKMGIGGACAGLAIGVFSQYGMEEAHWEEWWRQ